MNEAENKSGNSAGKKRCTPTPPMLINEISRLFHAKMRTYETDSLLSQDSIRLILRELGHCDGCSQLDLVHKTHLKPPTVSVSLKKLEDAGLVERVSDPADLRVTRVYLSEKGRAHQALVLEHLHNVDETLMQGFKEEERASLLQYLERMRNNILSAADENHAKEKHEKIGN